MRQILQSIRDYITGEKYLPRDSVELEIVLADGTTEKGLRKGDLIVTRSGKKYGINSQGKPYLAYDPNFKLKKIGDSDLPEDVKEQLQREVEITTVVSAFVLTLLVGGVMALIVLAVA